MNNSIISPKIIESISKLEPKYFANSFPKIFSWNELENLLNLRPFTNVKRFKITNDVGYSWNHQVWLSDSNTFPATTLNTILKNHTCYFSDSSRVNKSINQICKEIENTFPDHGADAHIYFTVADDLSGGFDAHWDHSHNLIVQVEGTTRFQIWDLIANSELDDRIISNIQQEPMIDVILNPGDAVFVPMHQYHKAMSQTKRLSVSFPFCPSNGIELQDRNWIQLF